MPGYHPPPLKDATAFDNASIQATGLYHKPRVLGYNVLTIDTN